MCVCICVRNLIWQPPQLSDYWPPSFVGWPRRMWWEWPLRERLWRDKDCKSEWEKIEGVKGRRKERKIEWKRDGVMEPVDVKVPLITSCFSSTPSLCLFLSVSLFLSFRSHLNSSPSASLRRDVGFWSTITTEMRQPRPTHTYAGRAHEFRVPLQVKSGTQESMNTHKCMSTATHRGGLWLKAPHKT